ncbi:hypothetical protein [Aphanothece microscopica]
MPMHLPSLDQQHLSAGINESPGQDAAAGTGTHNDVLGHGRTLQEWGNRA